MIRKLKIRLIALSMSALVVLLALIVAGMNLISYNALVQEADNTLSILSQNKGHFPDQKKAPETGTDSGPMPHASSPELPYESRYFSVVLNKEGEVLFSDTDKIASVTSSSAIPFAETVETSGKIKGFVDQFRFIRCEDDTGNIRIIFLDCGRKLDSFLTFFYSSLIMSCAGVVVVFFVILFFAGKIIRPIAESYEKQKRFITDAGHEIKTPLTIIQANTDLMEMEFGKNESLQDIEQQVTRLRDLTDDLVLLARMEESEQTLQKIPFPLSEVAEELLQSFQKPASQNGQTLQYQIAPMVSVTGNQKAIRQLLSILIDNALKYTPSGGTILFTLEKQNRTARLTLSNTTAAPIQSEDLSHIFDRFYRTDTSRNSETGGHGIGLSVAKAIITAHNGKIQATAPNNTTFQITVTLPL